MRTGTRRAAVAHAFALTAVLGPRVAAQDTRITKVAATDCAALSSLTLDDVRITQAAAIQPTEAQRAAGRGPLCRVAGVIGAETHFVALLPDRWNRRLLMGGGGGFVGVVDNQAQSSVNAGYATAGTDAGHAANPLTARWALNNDERQASFAHAAVHRTAEVTKQIIRAYHGSAPEKSYFFGCSNGGRQALIEAQRYPNDFDGIVSVAPAFNFAAVMTSWLRNLKVQFPASDFSRATITAENLALIQAKILEACDSRDGVKDGVLEDPRACDFRVASLPACPSDAAAADCVTRTQRAAIEQIYAPVRVTGEPAYPGQPLGNEADPESWSSWITGITPSVMTTTNNHAPTVQGAFATEFFKYFVFGDSTWDYTKYDLARAEADTKRADALVSATNPDLSAFTARGGKLILAHGWSDPALNALATVGYYESVRARDASSDRSLRLYMMPGVLHCAGGSGCDVVDWYTVIADWVERGVAPGRVVASKLGAAPAQGAPRTTVRTRPLCPYPQHARYSGSGSTDDEKNFNCR